MKKLVISLLRRPDRKSEFQKNNLKDFKYVEAVDGSQEIFRHINSNFIDPFRNRPLLQNEVACFLSHIRAWQDVMELNEPCIIMEDDAIINENWNEELYEEKIKEHDFIYLQRNENEPENTKSIDLHLERPSYPYNMTAYVITPKCAMYLINRVDYQDFKPVDEFLPEMINDSKLDIVALKIDACNQLPREMGDIESSEVFRNYKTHVLTCGTDRKKLVYVNTSANHHGIYPINIGNNIEWKGTDMKALGGGMKINLTKEYIKNLPDNDVVLFTDGYDVFYADNLDTIIERYEQMDAEVIFSAEAVCWPDPNLADEFPEAPTKYAFINSGTYIGKVGELKKILNNYEIADDDDDQLYIHKCFLTGLFKIKLDYEGYIFQTHELETTRLGNQLNNPITQCCPCIYHGNGGDDAYDKFRSLYDSFYFHGGPLFIKSNKVEHLSRDMLVTDFMTQEQCERLIEIADKHGGWGSLAYDKFPAQEIRMRALGLWEELETAWNNNIVPVVEKYWKPLQMYGLRDGFVMRYALDTQVKLALHHDASLVTGSVKLNEDYEGAELIYPRQGVSNKDIPVGKIILFPGQVTHGHECLPLTAGVKYSLTIWSCRYVNDNI